MPDALWKAIERYVAEALGGRRIGPVGQRGYSADVENKSISAEVKTRKKLPQWLLDAMTQAEDNRSDPDLLPIVVLHEKGQRREEMLVVIRLKDFVGRFVE